MESNVPHMFGDMFIGSIIATMLYGVTCGQVLRYYRLYGDDQCLLRYSVGALWIMDSLQQGFVTHALYYYLVSRCNGNPRGYISSNWSITAELIPAVICALMVEIFFIKKIRSFGRKNLAIMLLILAVLAAGFSLVGTVRTLMKPSFILTPSEFELAKWLACAAAACYTVVDLGTAVAMFCYLYKSRQTIAAASRFLSVITILIQYVIATGLLTSVVMFVGLISYVKFIKSGNLIFYGVYSVHTRIYVNSMLVSLNSREGLGARMRGDSDASVTKLRMNTD